MFLDKRYVHQTMAKILQIVLRTDHIFLVVHADRKV